jgi:hypothetical protein
MQTCDFPVNAVRSIAQPPNLAAMVGNSWPTPWIADGPISTAEGVGKMKNVRGKSGSKAIFAA